MRERVLKYGGREEGDYRIRAKKNLGTGEAGREKHQIFFFIFIQMNILCLQNHHDL